MKTTLATALLLCSAMASFGQGTIGFQNSVLYQAKLAYPAWGPHGPTGDYTSIYAVPTTPGLINYGVFFGTSSDALSLDPSLGHNSTYAAGIIDASSAFQLPGTNPGDTVWMQIKGWSASFGSDWRAASYSIGDFYGETELCQIKLGPVEGPGTPIWQATTGTSPNKFHPLVMVYGMVPEPGTLAIGSLGAVMMLLGRRWNRKP